MKKNELDRRTFLRNSIITGASAMLAPTLLAKSKQKETQPQVDNKPLIKRKLGKTGIELPIVSFGVMRADSPALIREAIKEGIVLFDTAHGYQGGRNEEMLGEVLKDYPRNSFVLATKVPPEFSNRQDGGTGSAFNRKAFLENIDISLKRLKMDYVDIFYAHGLMNRDTVLSKELMETMIDVKKSGKVKHVGVSTHTNQAEVIRACIESGVYEVVLASINFKQDYYADLKKAIGEAAKAGVGIVAMKTMAGGFHDKARTQPINCKAALKFVLQDENVTTAIPGNSNFDQLTMNASVNHDVILTVDEKADLAKGESQGSLYCQGCQQCVKNCPKRLPIPDIMRAYMYTYGYRDNEQAFTLLKSLELPENPCKDCATCTATCKKKFAVSERIADVMRLTSIPEEFIS